MWCVPCPCFPQIFLIICIKTSQTLQILLVTTEYFVIPDTGPRHWLLSDMRWYWMESAKSKVNNNLESQYWYRRGGGEDRRLTTECKGWNLLKSIIHFQFSNNCYWSGPGSTFYGRAETDSEREEPMKGPTSVKQLHSPTVLIDAIKNENFPPRNSYNAV